MNGLIAFAVHRWQATLVVFALVAALGIQAFLSIPRSVDPQFIAPIVQVIAVLPGADPADIEQTVVKPVEEALAGLDNMTELQSTASDGQGVIVAEFTWESDPNGNYDEAVREVNAIRPSLPAGIQRLEYRRFRTSDTSVVQYAIVSETASWRRMEKVGKDLKELFQRQKGVRTTVVWGVPKPEIRVSVDLGRLAQLGIPVTQVADALRLGGTDLPPGPMRSGEQRFNLRAGGAFRDLAEVRAVPLRADGERMVRVGDVATVVWETSELGNGNPERRRERAGCAEAPGRRGRQLRQDAAARHEAEDRLRPVGRCAAQALPPRAGLRDCAGAGAGHAAAAGAARLGRGDGLRAAQPCHRRDGDVVAGLHAEPAGDHRLHPVAWHIGG
jgi:multidrug efflux pump subunit AcrB